MDVRGHIRLRTSLLPSTYQQKSVGLCLSEVCRSRSTGIDSGRNWHFSGLSIIRETGKAEMTGIWLKGEKYGNYGRYGKMSKLKGGNSLLRSGWKVSLKYGKAGNMGRRKWGKRGFVQCGHFWSRGSLQMWKRGSLQMWTSALFGAKNVGFLRGGWVKLGRTFFGQGEGGVNFWFCADVFCGRLLIKQ